MNSKNQLIWLIVVVLLGLTVLGFFVKEQRRFGSGTSTQTIGGNLVVNGTLTATGAVTSGAQTMSSSTIGALTAGTLNVTSTASFVGLSTHSAGFVSQASSTVVGSFNPTSLTLATGKNLMSMTSATSSLNFETITNGTCSSTTMTVTGANAGSTSPDSVILGYDPVLKSGYATHTTWSAWSSATNVVTVQGCAGTSTAMIDPPALVFRATVLNFNP